jgi:hypothetical protein
MTRARCGPGAWCVAPVAGPRPGTTLDAGGLFAGKKRSFPRIPNPQSDFKVQQTNSLRRVCDYQIDAYVIDMNRNARLERAARAREIIAVLSEWWPGAFSIYEQRRRPALTTTPQSFARVRHLVP